MNLPHYFIADLPAEAQISPQLIRDGCQTLKRNRERYLIERPTRSLIRVISEIASNWLDPQYPFRQLALEHGPAATGFSAQTLGLGLDTFFRQLTSPSLEALLTQELGNERRLDFMSPTEVERRQARAAMAQGPELLVHIAAGNIPNPTLLAMTLGLLVRSAQFVKCASGRSLFPRLFAHSLYEADHTLCSSLEIAEWKGGNAELDTALFEAADCVSATGGDQTLDGIRPRLPARVRFLGYGHRVSFGYVTREAMAPYEVDRAAARAATDVVAWDQLGCLSPHVLYVETGGTIAAEQFAARLAGELARCEIEYPRGILPVETAATLAHWRGIYEVRAAYSPETKLWCSPGSTAWTVVYESDPLFQSSCLHRFIFVKPVKDLTQALQSADRVRGQVSTVGLAATEARAAELAVQMARWGVTRVCSLGRMQEPPLTWRHDGRPALGDLVTWTDWETEG